MGHAVGDRVLQTFAQTATATLGADVLFGRIGGEEFASLLPVGDLGEAYAIADRVRRNFAEAAARFADGDLTPTVSVGRHARARRQDRGRRAAGGRRPRALSRQGQWPQSRRGDRAARRGRAHRRRAPSIVPLIGPERVPRDADAATRAGARLLKALARLRFRRLARLSRICPRRVHELLTGASSLHRR